MAAPGRPEQPGSPDYSLELGILESMLHIIDQRAWSVPGFPAEHKPDLDRVSRNMRVGAIPIDVLRPHPALKDDELRRIRAMNEYFAQQVDLRAQAAHVYPGEVWFAPHYFRNDEEKRYQIAAHEIAHDRAVRYERINFNEFGPMARTIAHMLASQCKPGFAPRVQDEYILKMGFGRLVMESGYELGELVGDAGDPLNELYAQIMQVVVPNLVILDGNINLLDELAAGNTLPIRGDQDHPESFPLILQTIAQVGWRPMADAALSGDVSILVDTFQRLGLPNFITSYMKALRADRSGFIITDEIIQQMIRISNGGQEN